MTDPQQPPRTMDIAHEEVEMRDAVRREIRLDRPADPRKRPEQELPTHEAPAPARDPSPSPRKPPPKVIRTPAAPRDSEVESESNLLGRGGRSTPPKPLTSSDWPDQGGINRIARQIAAEAAERYRLSQARKKSQ